MQSKQFFLYREKQQEYTIKVIEHPDKERQFELYYLQAINGSKRVLSAVDTGDNIRVEDISKELNYDSAEELGILLRFIILYQSDGTLKSDYLFDIVENKILTKI